VGFSGISSTVSLPGCVVVSGVLFLEKVCLCSGVLWSAVLMGLGEVLAAGLGQVLHSS
jgi:hypothetical protein